MALFWHEERSSANKFILEIQLNHGQITRLKRRSPVFFREFASVDDIPYDEMGLFSLVIDSTSLHTPQTPSGSPTSTPSLSPSSTRESTPTPHSSSVSYSSHATSQSPSTPSSSLDIPRAPRSSSASALTLADTAQPRCSPFPVNFPIDCARPASPTIPRHITLPPTVDEFISACSAPVPAPSDEDIRIHTNYLSWPSLPFDQSSDYNPEGYPLLVSPDVYHFVLAIDILTRPDDTYVIPFIPKYFNFLQMVNLGLYLQSPYLNIYISKWYAEPIDLTFLFSFTVRYAFAYSPTGRVQPSVLALDPTLCWLFRLFRSMVPLGLPTLEELIVLTREETELGSSTALRFKHRGRFTNVFKSGASFSCPIYPQLLYKTLVHIDASFPEYQHKLHFSRSHITCALCNRPHPRQGVQPSVFADLAATELAILPCCFSVVHPSCLLTLLALLATGVNLSVHQALPWYRHAFFLKYLHEPFSLFPAAHSPPRRTHQCEHCHSSMDITSLLLLGKNMEHAFQAAILSPCGVLVQPPMPLMRRGGSYNLTPLIPHIPPLFQNFYDELLILFRKSIPTQYGADVQAPTLHCLTPSTPAVLHEEDFAHPISHLPWIFPGTNQNADD